VRIDVVAGEPQFIDHLAPIFRALPERSRGDFIIRVGRNAKMTEAEMIARANARKVLATTEIEDPSRPVLIASAGDHHAVRKQGRERIARMEHGIGQSFIDSDHESYAGGVGAADVGLFLTPNRHSARRWADAYPAATVAVVGCPKLDELPSRRIGPKPVVALSFHWGLGVPTPGRLGETHGSFPEYREVIGAVAGQFRVIGHGHPRMLPYLARHYRRLRIPVVEDFAEVCRQADVYVCDTNSTIYEFASTGRPVVVVNGRHFRRDVEHGLRFWEAATVGVQCDRPADLIGSIREALVDRPAQQRERERALDIVYAYRTGAAKRAATALTRWARGSRLVAVA
jgi:hypothetical protein